MKSGLRCIECAAAALLAVVVMIGGAQALPVAQVTNLVNAAFRSPPGETELPVKVSDQLVLDEALRTEPESTVDLTFIDGSQMSLEPESELVLSKYVFDPDADHGNKQAAAVINLNSGTFHYDSNGASDELVVLKTPVATIGIRGTELIVHVGPSLTDPSQTGTWVEVVSGKIFVQPTGSGKSCEGVAGESVSVGGPNEDATVGGNVGGFSTAAGGGSPQDDDSTVEKKAKESPEPPEPKGDAHP